MTCTQYQFLFQIFIWFSRICSGRSPNSYHDKYIQNLTIWNGVKLHCRILGIFLQKCKIVEKLIYIYIWFEYQHQPTNISTPTKMDFYDLPKTRQERKGRGQFCRKRVDVNYNQKTIRIKQILRERSKNNFKKST